MDFCHLVGLSMRSWCNSLRRRLRLLQLATSSKEEDHSDKLWLRYIPKALRSAMAWDIQRLSSLEGIRTSYQKHSPRLLRRILCQVLSETLLHSTTYSHLLSLSRHQASPDSSAGQFWTRKRSGPLGNGYEKRTSLVRHVNLLRWTPRQELVFEVFACLLSRLLGLASLGPTNRSSLSRVRVAFE